MPVRCRSGPGAIPKFNPSPHLYNAAVYSAGKIHMAKVLFTAVVADMRGKIAGTVFTKNKSGAVARTKVSPVNGRTPAQTTARARLSRLSAGWRTLTPSQREGWITRATEAFGTDVFGNTKTISGQQLYISVNTNRELTGGVVVPIVPKVEGPAYTGVITVTSTVTTGVMTLLQLGSTGVVAPDTVFIVATTGALSAGISNPTGKFKALGVNLLPAATPEIQLPFAAKFGTAYTGDKIFIRLTPVNTRSGTSGAPIIMEVIVGGSASSALARGGGDDPEELENEGMETGRKKSGK